jgi:hypothetical protein
MNKTIKDIFDEKINKKEIYNKVLFKLERKNSMKNNSVLRYVIPTFVMIIICAIFVVNNKKVGVDKQNIFVNEIKNKDEVIGDIDGRYEEISLNEIEKILPFVKDVIIPNNLEGNRTGLMYASNDVTSERYNMLIGYSIMYFNDDELVDIFVSETEKVRPRCLYYITDEMKPSFINGIEIKIGKYGNEYIVTFSYDNKYFDIETRNIDKNSLITLIKSIIK